MFSRAVLVAIASVNPVLEYHRVIHTTRTMFFPTLTKEIVSIVMWGSQVLHSIRINGLHIESCFSVLIVNQVRRIVI